MIDYYLVGGLWSEQFSQDLQDQNVHLHATGLYQVVTSPRFATYVATGSHCTDSYHLRDAIDDMPFYAPVVGGPYPTLYLISAGIFHTDDNNGWENGASRIGSLPLTNTIIISLIHQDHLWMLI